MVDELLCRYLRHLLRQKRYSLIPFYTCRLSAERRRQMCCNVLSQLSKEGDADAKQAAYEDLDRWFGVWRDQELGDVEPDELDVILALASFKLAPSCTDSLQKQQAA